jgi:PTH1 family peptidyl-tRNA hydrolase
MTTLLGPRLIVGLGNPGREYECTRHNAGFAVIDAFAAELGVSYWKLASNTLVGETSYRSEKIILAKPQAFMNLSGGPVKGLLSRYGLDIEDVLVIHDELDLPAGTLRLKLGGGHAGHNGLRSLHQSIGADFARLRVGIGRPPGRMPARAWVLQRMSGDEWEDFEVTCASAIPVVRTVLEDGLTRAMTEYNRVQTAKVAGGETEAGAGTSGAAEGEAVGKAEAGTSGEAEAGTKGDGSSVLLRTQDDRTEASHG